MSSARLLALRLHGFKSFAERTTVEFGAGISAVVGPNGSGKSNLADGLRWALGEQGRALRSRKSEDVIFAGSDRRPALGMADVSLVLDNADGLLPVDYQVLELGRRLYRSGENDYLLNRGRVRLKDLVDLLDAAHLADNAFLFIGQGMVDQALSLRPEERRPLFEEVAGVRRHERRRRRAEEQLAEAETNLARVEDILGELRPQARRLAAQAEQQTRRANAGDDLAAAIVLSGHARWHAAARTAQALADRSSRTRLEVERATAELLEAEAASLEIGSRLARQASIEVERRDAHEAARSALTALQLESIRHASEVEAIKRDRARLEAERTAAEAELAARRRALAAPAPERDAALAAAADVAEQALAEARRELGELQGARQAAGQERAAFERAVAARQAELENARRLVADGERRVRDERARAVAGTAERTAVESALEAAQSAHRAAIDAELAGAALVDRARTDADAAEGARRVAEEQAAVAGESLASARARLATATARIAEDEERGIARAARRAGGRRIDNGLQVDPAFRAAVELALGELARGYLVDPAAVLGLSAERGSLVVDGRVVDSPPPSRFLDRLATMGGGLLGDAIRRDEVGAARSVLDRVAWLPDLAAALDLQRILPPGWQIVVRDGSALLGATTVALGRADGTLERQAAVERLQDELARLEARAGDADRARAVATERSITARSALAAARAEEARIGAARRAAEDQERVAARSVERLAREASWLEAGAHRAEADLARHQAALAALEPAPDLPQSPDGRPAGDPADDPADDHPAESAIAAWEGRIAELRGRRDLLAGELAEHDRIRALADAARAREAAGATMSQDRIERADQEMSLLGQRESGLLVELDRLAVDVAAATSREASLQAALAEIRAADAVDRGLLVAADQALNAARERLRSIEDRRRAVEVAELEGRLALDLIREQVTAELGGLGSLGLRAVGLPVADEDDDTSLDVIPEAILAAWAAVAPAGEAPSAGRLASLRRRYHELGSGNPLAVEEYAEVRARLETLETQEHDLRTAIATTRDLIEELGTMVADQFKTTFRNLEVAFDARFKQLFGGGYARLELTDPEDLSVTGVEIVARPPGKKPQALAMLSGGERALTAVALLFAMLAVRPVPFCVLDEVDAALDEANIGRFADALRELAGQIQFIVITHNRGTIEAADALYGVTVGDDSVSRVISLRLDEATAIADRSGEPAGLAAS
ncbi:MAG TPA: chromosome segregation protein SMC [Candidatus Limnocylindrales bacterium]|nr:chromosome segregation protein SMC [Candidatus Limnocylindrales bacterium]